MYEDINGHPAALSNLPSRVRDGRYGVYAMALQQVTTHAVGSKQGVSVFANVTLADRNTALVRNSVTLGVWDNGPFVSRPDDRVELALGAWAVEKFEAKSHLHEDSFSTICWPIVVLWAKKRRKNGPGR